MQHRETKYGKGERDKRYQDRMRTCNTCLIRMPEKGEKQWSRDSI